MFLSVGILKGGDNRQITLFRSGGQFPLVIVRPEPDNTALRVRTDLDPL